MRAQRRREAAEDAASERWRMASMGFGEPPKTHSDVIERFVAGAAYQDQIDDARARSDRELRQRDAADRLAAADADRRVAVEARRAEILGRSLTKANRLIGAGYQPPADRGSYYRSDSFDEYSRLYTR